MDSIETFAVIGGDLRSSYLAGALVSRGYKVITSGFDSTDLPPCVTGCTNPAQAVAFSDCVILPMPVTTDGTNVNAPYSRMRISLDQVLNAMQPSQKLVGGSVSPIVQNEAHQRGLEIQDYLQREELAVKNAVPTAEGAVQLAMEELPVTIRDSQCLITGYGRVGRSLAKVLIALGANVTVCARKLVQRAWAETDGCSACSMEDLVKCPTPDVIFNTIPFMIFSKDVLHALDKNTLIIDLASRPGGVDFNAAAELQIKTIWALSLPGRVAPKTAGSIIAETIINMLK